MKINNWKKAVGIIFLSLTLILFTQWVKTIKNPESLAPSLDTVIGLLFLGLFAIIGMWVKEKLVNVKYFSSFPVMGWVCIVSLGFCMAFPKIIDYINAIDFLSLTTPVLAFAGISVANKLETLKSLSWKIVIVGCFVFIGTYLGSALVAHFAMSFMG
ncbi:MAG: hypothetical protein Q4E36_05730 [Bacillota bacterium]|nr:hypothetical protein [Bacillota bacterium]